MMRRTLVRMLGSLFMVVPMLLFSATPAAAQDRSLASRGDTLVRRPLALPPGRSSDNFARTELFFGTAKPDGVVTDEDFLLFLDAEITPRFPAGLTLVRADGQFQIESGEIIREKSFLLILLYPAEEFRQNSRRINAIRELYKREFQQESVLRVDDPFAVRVSF
jgi:hypothetical protein